MTPFVAIIGLIFFGGWAIIDHLEVIRSNYRRLK